MRYTKRRRRLKSAPQVSLSQVACAFCKGTGRDPFRVLSPLSNCPACGGRKTLRVRDPYETCSACQGTGWYFNSKMYCWPCRGAGAVPAPKQAAAV